MFNTASCLGLAGVGDVVEQGDVLVAARLGVRYPKGAIRIRHLHWEWVPQNM